jgi:hypothetical protein
LGSAKPSRPSSFSTAEVSVLSSPPDVPQVVLIHAITNERATSNAFHAMEFSHERRLKTRRLAGSSSAGAVVIFESNSDLKSLTM